jgi:hypothetical protein
VVVVAAAVALGFAAMSRPSAAGRPAASPPAAPSPRASPGSASAATASSAPEEAAAVNRVLASSAATRTALRDAVRQIRACTNLPGAVGELQDVVSRRITESRLAATLPTGALADGAAVKSGLISVLGKSLQADRDYLAWAQQLQASGCTQSGQAGAYQTALNANQVADAAKQAFAQVWNQVAPKYGIGTILPGGF